MKRFQILVCRNCGLAWYKLGLDSYMYENSSNEEKYEYCALHHNNNMNEDIVVGGYIICG